MRIALLILGSFFSVYAYAGIFKCTDADGKTDYRSKPCDPELKAETINIKTGSLTDETEKEKQQQLTEQQEQEQLQAQEQEERKRALQKQNAIDESAKNQFLIKNNPEKFSPFSIPPYDPDQLNSFVGNFQSRLAEIERFRRQAAEKALATDQCTRVESSELHSSSSRKLLVFSVDCSSGKNFQYSEQELNQ